MANNTRAINLVDFTGGLNFRGDAFELSDNESPDMLNVDIDGRGGFVARKGWTRWNEMAFDSAWNPRTMFVHELSSGVDRIYIAANQHVVHTTDGVTWTQVTVGSAIDAKASPHNADFAPWGDTLYIACGNSGSDPAVKINAALTASKPTQAEGANFSPYTAPVAAFPHCNFIAPYSGYMFAAGTEESGDKFPNRLRWSHFNNPDAWASSDFQDFNEGGGPITGIVPMQDHLLIFKQSQVWALFGYDADSWQFVNVSREVGAPHRQAITRSESAVFFYTHALGVYVVAGGQTPQELSSSLRPMFTDAGFNATKSTEIWLGWIGQRLWFSVPFAESPPDDAVGVFVFDPTVGDGAWVRFASAWGGGLGPFAQTGFGGGAQVKLACARGVATVVVKLDDSDEPVDNIDSPIGFESHYVTRWIHGDMPTLKKSWRRPDFVVKERTSAHEIQVDVFRDYDEANPIRHKTINVAAGAGGAVYGAFDWGDGTLYGEPAKGSVIERGGSLGTARAVQLRLSGEPEKQWGVDAVVLKVIPRRLR